MNLLCHLVLNALIVFAGLWVASADALRDSKVVGIHVNKKIVDGPDVTDPQTSVEIMIRKPGNRIVGLASIEVSSFTDDKATDLAKNQDFNKNLDFPTRFKDGSRIVFPVRSSIPPARGATKLRLKASVGLRLGRDVTTVEKKNIKLVADASVKVGPFELSPCQQYLEANETGVTVAYLDDILKSVEFVDNDGEVISSRLVGRGSSSGRQVSYDDEYALIRKSGPFTARITYYSRSDTVMVPLDLEAELGF